MAQPDAARVSKLVLDLAQNQLNAQIRAADSYDVKSTAVLAFVGIALSLILGSKGSLGQGWWIPAALVLAAGAFAVLALIDRAYHLGPEADAFYNQYGGLSENEAQVTLLAHLVSSRKSNEGVLKWKSRYFIASVTILVVAGGASVVVLLLGGK